VLTGVQRRANELGYSLLLSLVRDPDSNSGEEIFLNLLDHQVDGIIWAVPEIGDNREWIARKLSHFSSPVVFINMEPVSGLHIAAMNNREGGRLAVEHLTSQGYRNIGIITGPQSWWEARQREQGWHEAVLSAGLSTIQPEQMRAEGDWYPSSGESALEELLLRCPDIEAVFVCNDPMAAGALRAARRLGRCVPDDLAIVGYDDTPEASYYYPSLTTVRQPLFEMGGQAVEMLHHLLLQSRSGQEMVSSPALWLHPELIVRESSVRR
jgi:LacI family transcriptional regulator